MTALVQAGYLTLWGIAIVLIWIAGTRLVNMGQGWLAHRGYIRVPREMVPIIRRNDVTFAWVAFASGSASLIAFSAPAGEQMAVSYGHWLIWFGSSPLAQLIRVILALNVLLFFLTRVAEHPRYKLWWAACWGVFSLAVVSLA